MNKLTHAEAHRLFNYNHLTGTLVRKITVSSQAKAGDIVGTDRNGYLYVEYRGKSYAVHRIIWLMMTGVWPAGVIDHHDHNRSNNIFSNLRSCNHGENARNRKTYANSVSGTKNVTWSKASNKWCVRLHVDGKLEHIGLFEDLELAQFVSEEARLKYHGSFATS